MLSGKRSRWFIAIIPATAALWSAAMMYAAWDHNPQGRFHEGDVIHWGQWLGAVGAIHFLLGLLAGCFLWIFVVAFVNAVKKPSGP